MLSNILIMAAVGFAIGWGYSQVYVEQLAEKDKQYDKLIEETQAAHRLMAAELEDSELRLSKVNYTVLEQRAEIKRLKEMR